MAGSQPTGTGIKKSSGREIVAKVEKSRSDNKLKNSRRQRRRGRRQQQQKVKKAAKKAKKGQNSSKVQSGKLIRLKRKSEKIKKRNLVFLAESKDFCEGSSEDGNSLHN